MKTINICEKEANPFSEYYQFTPSENNHYFGSIPVGAVKTRGFIHYLGQAWNRHYPVRITPTDIWYTIVGEIALEINKNPNNYATLFTTTPGEKQAIIIQTDDEETIDIDMLVDRIKGLLPTQGDTFLPSFSTDTDISRFALNVSFCDMTSPYYNYFTMMCGIPAVEVGGTEEDWKRIQTNLEMLENVFKTSSLTFYLGRCRTLVGEMIKNTLKGNAADYFKKMVSVCKCGSGGEEDLSGWILGFLNTNRENQISMRTDNIHTHIAKMTYTNLETQRKFQIAAGVMYVYVNENGLLLPGYNACRTEISNQKEDIQSKGRVNRKVDPNQKIEFVTQPIVAKTRKIKGTWTIEDTPEVIAQYSTKLDKLDRALSKALETPIHKEEE